MDWCHDVQVHLDGHNREDLLHHRHCFDTIDVCLFKFSWIAWMSEITEAPDLTYANNQTRLHQEWLSSSVSLCYIRLPHLLASKRIDQLSLHDFGGYGSLLRGNTSVYCNSKCLKTFWLAPLEYIQRLCCAALAICNCRYTDTKIFDQPWYLKLTLWSAMQDIFYQLFEAHESQGLVSGKSSLEEFTAFPQLAALTIRIRPLHHTKQQISLARSFTGKPAFSVYWHNVPCKGMRLCMLYIRWDCHYSAFIAYR